jgi:hypothetical protein
LTDRTAARSSQLHCRYARAWRRRHSVGKRAICVSEPSGAGHRAVHAPWPPANTGRARRKRIVSIFAGAPDGDTITVGWIERDGPPVAGSPRVRHGRCGSRRRRKSDKSSRQNGETENRYTKNTARKLAVQSGQFSATSHGVRIFPTSRSSPAHRLPRGGTRCASEAQGHRSSASDGVDREGQGQSRSTAWLGRKT